MAIDERCFEQHLGGARRGAQPSFQWLWQTYAPSIAGFLTARGTPEVDEVVNDVFVAGFERLDRFEGGESDFRGWLFGIARHKRIDQLRRHGRRPTTAPLGDAGYVVASSVEDDSLHALGDLELLQVLGSLTSDQRDVIVLRFVVDLSLDQTAAALEKPVGAVKALQHRALEQLRKKFSLDPYLTTTLPSM